MKVIRCKYLPLPKTKKMITLFGCIFTRPGAVVTETDENHEDIHVRQKFEMAFLGFCAIFLAVIFGLSPWWLLASPFTWHIWYFMEWLVRSIQYKDFHVGYQNIAFEREARENDDNLDYLETRGWHAWWRYL